MIAGVVYRSGLKGQAATTNLRDDAINVQFSTEFPWKHYWSATTVEGAPDYLFGVDFHDGAVTTLEKSGENYIWIVRG